MKVTSVGDFRWQQGGMSAGVASDAVVRTPIKPGEMTVPAMVTVTYELE